MQRDESTTMLQAAALTRRFGNLTAVDRLTLSVREGEVFGLLGCAVVRVMVSPLQAGGIWRSIPGSTTYLATKV